MDIPTCRAVFVPLLSGHSARSFRSFLFVVADSRRGLQVLSRPSSEAVRRCSHRYTQSHVLVVIGGVAYATTTYIPTYRVWCMLLFFSGFPTSIILVFSFRGCRFAPRASSVVETFQRASAAVLPPSTKATATLHHRRPAPLPRARQSRRVHLRSKLLQPCDTFACFECYLYVCVWIGIESGTENKLKPLLWCCRTFPA